MLNKLTTTDRSPSNVLVVTENDDAPVLRDRTEEFTPLILTFRDHRHESETAALKRKYGTLSPELGVISVDPETGTGSYASALDTPDIEVDVSDPATLVETYLAERSESKPVLYVDSIETLVRTVNLEESLGVLRELTASVTQNGGVGYYCIGGDIDSGVIDSLSPVFDSVEYGIAGDAGRVERAAASIGIGAVGRDAGFSTDGPLGLRPAGSQDLTPTVWLLAIVTFGLGDILTTIAGLHMSIIVEASPVAAQIIGANGLGFIYVVKLSTFVIFYLLWKFSPDPHRIGIPLGLSLLGVVVTTWNLSVIFQALST